MSCHKACDEIDNALLDCDNMLPARASRTRRLKTQPILLGATKEQTSGTFGSPTKPTVRFSRTVTVASISTEQLKDEGPLLPQSCLSLTRMKARARSVVRTLRGRRRPSPKIKEETPRSVVSREGSQVRFDYTVSVAEVCDDVPVRYSAGNKPRRLRQKGEHCKSRSIEKSPCSVPSTPRSTTWSPSPMISVAWDKFLRLEIG